jgi:serine/threonine protein phosphatase PrpC
LKSAPSGEPVLLAESQDIGYGARRTRLEDRLLARRLTSVVGLELWVGMIADGIGGASAGETASQIAVDQALESLRLSHEGDLSTMLRHALQAVHAAVQRTAAGENKALAQMGTTATLAAIHQGRLYLAHVGDSRAYLVRGGRLRLLTLDHTWGNEMVRLGRFSPGEVGSHPRRDELARYIGMPGSLEIDSGPRRPGGRHPALQPLDEDGLPLLPGDVVLLCSDGLIKPRKTQPGNFVEDAEILKVVGRKRHAPQDLANTLVSLALGRQVDDNVSVVVMEIPGGEAHLAPLAPESSRPVFPIVISALALLLLAILGVMLLSGRGGALPAAPASPPVTLTPEQTSPPLDLTDAVQVLQGNLDVRQAGQPARLAGPGDSLAIRAETGLRAIGPARLGLPDGAEIMLDNSAEISLAPDTFAQVTLADGRLLVTRGELTVRAAGHAYLARGASAVMGVAYSPLDGRFWVDCLYGRCTVGDALQLAEGQSGGYAQGALAPPGLAVYLAWTDLGAPGVPTPTATATSTSTSTPTPTPSATPSPLPLPTATATPTERPPKPPPATDTPIPGVQG